MVAIVSFKRDAIHRAVRDMYTQVAAKPEEQYHFPTGHPACTLLGYPDELIQQTPDAALESFAGVGYPFATKVIKKGDTVLDVGSGSGTDALICSRLVGKTGLVYALDMTAGMRDKLQRTINDNNYKNVEVIEGDAEKIPLPDHSVDVITSNGVLNLVPNKRRAIEELARVLKPGGKLQLSDIALTKKVSERYRQDPQMWAECVVGAVEEDHYFHMLEAAGFESITPVASVDYFSHSVSDKTREVAGLFNAHSITLHASRSCNVDVSAAGATRRAAMNMGRELLSVGGAVFAWFVCAGLPALIAFLGAMGIGGLANHGVMFPLFIALIAAGVWFIWRSGRLRNSYGPFFLALGGAVFAVVTTWLALTGIFPFMAMWPHVGIAMVVGASAWNFIQSRQPGNCLEEMIREEQLRQQRPGPIRRVANALAATMASATVLFAAHVSVI